MKGTKSILWNYKDNIIKMYNDENKTLQYIADRYNVSSTAVKNFLEKINIKRRMRGRTAKLKIEDIQKIIDEYKQQNKKIMIKELAEKLHITPPRLRVYIKRHLNDIDTSVFKKAVRFYKE